MAIAELAFEKGLPSSVDTERLVLGSILLNDAVYLQVAGSLSPEDFSLEKHRRIYGRMKDLYDRGERIDRVTLPLIFWKCCSRVTSSFWPPASTTQPPCTLAGTTQK